MRSTRGAVATVPSTKDRVEVKPVVHHGAGRSRGRGRGRDAAIVGDAKEDGQDCGETKARGWRPNIRGLLRGSGRSRSRWARGRIEDQERREECRGSRGRSVEPKDKGQPVKMNQTSRERGAS